MWVDFIGWGLWALMSICGLALIVSAIREDLHVRRWRRAWLAGEIQKRTIGVPDRQRAAY